MPLLRAARVLLHLGAAAEARALYQQLADISNVRIGGAPADLTALLSTQALTPADLLKGRWHLTRAQFDFFWPRVSPNQPPPADLQLWSNAAAQIAQTHPTANQLLWIGPTPLFLIASPNCAVLAKPESLMRLAAANEPIRYSATEPSGRLLAGSKPAAHPVVRTASESQLPWTLSFTLAPSATDSDLANRKLFLLLGLSVTVVFLAAGTFFIAHAIRREAQLARLQSDFVAAVSHEFRSPLTSLRHLSEILAEGRLPSDDRRQIYYETLVRESHRLQRLVETLLNFGGLESGNSPYHPQVLNLPELAARLLADLPSGRQRIQTSGPDPCFVNADPEALSVALRNLLDNALKYSPPGSPVLLEWTSGPTQASIAVHDQGPGIAPNERKLIFNKFVRGTAAARGNVKGTGVGLAIVDHIVKAHRGSVQVSGEPGRGSVFTVRLPLNSHS